MATDDAEEEELRAVALKNAESILIARRRAEIALLDIGMPALNGYEVAQTIRETLPASPLCLIAVTGWGQHSDKARARASGSTITSQSPWNPNDSWRCCAILQGNASNLRTERIQPIKRWRGRTRRPRPSQLCVRSRNYQ